jgi:mevalonate kinase
MECARAADQYAESEAEKEREYQMGEEANRRIEESKEEIHHNREEVSDLLSDIRDLLKERDSACEAFTNLMKSARRRIISLRERNHKLLKEMKILKDRPWELIHY